MAEKEWPSPDISLRSLFLGETGGSRNWRQRALRSRLRRRRRSAWGAVRGAHTACRVICRRTSASTMGNRWCLKRSLSPGGWSFLGRRCSRRRLRRSAECPSGRATVAHFAEWRGDPHQLRRAQSHASRQPCGAVAPRPRPRCRVSIKLNDVGQAIPAGYRLRLALSNAYWPTIWPSPQKTTLPFILAGAAWTCPFGHCGGR